MSTKARRWSRRKLDFRARVSENHGVSGRACLLLFLALPTVLLAAGKEARVTRIVREVNLLPNESKPQPAKLDAVVDETTAVRTGERSKSELTFRDLTLTRLGENTIYTHSRGGRSVELESGSILLRVPKNTGGASVRGNAVSVAVTGTTLILESSRGGRSRLIVLEGNARLSLRKVPAQTRDLRGGQMLEVPAGATTLGQPVKIDLDQLMQTHPLIVGFAPLPSRDLIAEAAHNEPVYQGTQVSGGGVGPILSGLGGLGLPSINLGGGSGGGTGRNPPGRGQRPPGRTPPAKANQQPTPPPVR